MYVSTLYNSIILYTISVRIYITYHTYVRERLRHPHCDSACIGVCTYMRV